LLRRKEKEEKGPLGENVSLTPEFLRSKALQLVFFHHQPMNFILFFPAGELLIVKSRQ
jgi:hypothetical protein